MLNERTEETKRVVHLMVTALCARNCKHCCNKQYDVNDIPYVTDEELKEADTICITGGEPFMFAEPCKIARYYKDKYKNIKNAYVYTNAKELADYLEYKDIDKSVDGLNVSIKTKEDLKRFEEEIVRRRDVLECRSNMLYVFDRLFPKECGNFKVIERVWQEEFEPAKDSIFRRV